MQNRLREDNRPYARRHGFITALLFVYIILRAVYIPAVHDEVATFLLYIRSLDFIPGLAHLDANNHLTSSIFGLLMYELFGAEMAFLRMPSALSFLIYAYFIYRISTAFIEKNFRLSFSIFMLCIPIVIEYFSLLRGYGMSFAFLSGFLYYSLRGLQEMKAGFLLFQALFLLLSLASGLNLLLICLMASGISLLFCLYQKKYTYLPIFLLHSIIFGYFIWYSFRLKAMGMLYYGGDTGFLEDTVKSLADLLLPQNPQAGTWILLLMALLSLFLPLYKKNRTINGLFFFVLFWGNIAAILLMHAILGVKFPTDRTALHLYFILLFLLSIGLFQNRKLLFSIAILGQLFLFMLNMNLTHSTFWRHEHISEELYNSIFDDASIHSPMIAGYKMNGLVLPYENYRRGRSAGDVISIDYNYTQADYILSEHYDTLQHHGDYTLIMQDPVSRKSVWKKKIPVVWSRADSGSVKSGLTNAMYMDVWKAKEANKYDGKDLRLCMEVRIKADKHAGIDFIFKDHNPLGHPDRHARLILGLQPFQDGLYTFHVDLYLKSNHIQDSDFSCFIYNPKEAEFSVEDLQYVLYTAEE